MFNAGLHALLEALPALADLDRPRVRRLLAGAWLDAVRHRDFAGDEAPAAAADLRRLATALEVRLFVGATYWTRRAAPGPSSRPRRLASSVS